IVLNGVTITNTDAPAIYVVSADKVFVTTTETENTLTVSGAFTADGDTNTDAVIFSKDDLVLNGLGTLNINSVDNGISCKDDLKITGGTYVIKANGDGIEANDSICISDGNITISSANDAIQAKNDEDLTVGYVYICGGNISINAGDDAIHGELAVQIDGGTIAVNAAEGIEGTYVQINGGDISVSASDDGINAAFKTNTYTPTVEINGGSIDITMGQGDTDAIDANGYIYINGGYVNISAQFAFDYDYGAELNGGTVIVNGSEVTSITNSMMGGGMMGGMPGGDMGGFGHHR
ncbi:MAG: carbohydrate-binding domain-containing protein, partial [Erysipelotrichaceae bacterium]|nr:carbohydrate-binding domain-containing protein [Erysipelotrichaceae bacterium]